MRYICSLLILLISSISFSQDFLWATKVNKTYGTTTFLKSICSDNLGNIYSVGNFSDGSDFETNPNNFSILTNSNVNGYGYLLKLDGNKNFNWVKQLPGTGQSVIIDSQENIIITGVSNNLIIDLDPGPNTQQIVNNPTQLTGSYIIKLNNAGDFIFGDFYPNIYSKEICTDLNNNIIITGNLGSSSSLNNVMFVKKINPIGNFIWQKNIAGNNIYPHSIVTNNNNEIILKGNFFLNMTFNNTNYSSSTYNDFIFKLNDNGDTIWFIKLFNTFSAAISNEDKSISIDQDDNIYFISHFVNSSSSNFPNTIITLNSYFGIDCGIFKIDTYGNLIWHKKIIGDNQQKGFSLDINNYNNTISVILYVNKFTYLDDINTLIFPILTNQNSTGLTIFFNTQGDFVNLLNTVNTQLHQATRIISTNINEYYIGGTFDTQLDFDPSSGIYNMNSFTNNGFILKLGNCDTTPPLGNSSQTFCSSQNPTIANLTPNSGIIKWYDSQTSTVQLQNTHALINGQTYYAAKQVGTCPESNDRLAVIVSIIQSPLAPNIINQAFCENENATLSSLNVVGQNLTFYDSNQNVIPNNTILINNETYHVSQTINNCESIKTSFTAIVNPNALPTLTSPQIFCFQQNATLNNIAITGQNIKWYDAVTGGNLLPNTTSLQNAITYYASQTISGCESNRVPILVTIQNTAAPTGNANQSFCSTENATLNSIVITGNNVIWYSSSTGTTILPTSTLLQNGVTYYASQTINGCESTLRLAVSIQLINTLNANNYSETICDDLNDGFETVNLSNYNSFLIASSGNVFKYYNSINGAQNQITSEETQNSNNYNLSIGNNLFYVRIESPNTCFQIVTLNLTLVRKPFISINYIMPICEGSSITINAGSGYDYYLWSTNEISSSITVNQPGSYSVTVSENHGSLVCSSTKNFAVVNSNIGTISEIITSDWTQDENTISVTLSSNSVGDYEYSLNGIDFQDSNTFYGLENGEYTVFIRDKNGCGISSQDVYLLMYPKYFTPNGDGFNDYWRIKFSENEPNLLVTIFDRYGKLIRQFYSNSNGWDGTFNGKQLPSTDYWFIVKRENGIEHKGHFSLKR